MSTPEVVVTWDGRTVRIIAVPRNDAGARLLLPFVERAWGDPDAERIMRDGLAFLGEFCNGGRVDADDEPTMLKSAARFLDRNYPVGVAA